MTFQAALVSVGSTALVAREWFRQEILAPWRWIPAPRATTCNLEVERLRLFDLISLKRKRCNRVTLIFIFKDACHVCCDLSVLFFSLVLMNLRVSVQTKLQTFGKRKYGRYVSHTRRTLLYSKARCEAWAIFGDLRGFGWRSGVKWIINCRRWFSNLPETLFSFRSHEMNSQRPKCAIRQADDIICITNFFLKWCSWSLVCSVRFTRFVEALHDR